MTKLVILAILVVTASGRNVVTAAPNCPDGQEYINDQCLDVWRQSLYDPYNVISVPPNCPSGQQWINGQCRDVWKLQGLEVKEKNTVIVPSNCPNGHQYLNGQCRDTHNVIEKYSLENWFQTLLKKVLNSQKNRRSSDEAKAAIQNRNIISVPNQCPNGQLPDSLGICRPVFD